MRTERFQSKVEQFQKIILIPPVLTNEWLATELADKSSMLGRWGFCYRDLSEIIFEPDLNLELLRKVPFDTTTIFPEVFPAGYNPKEIIAQATGQSLGLSELHNMGIDGRTITTAIIDAEMSPIHQENRHNIRINESTSSRKSAHFHGVIVAALLAGKEMGVAPATKVEYYGVSQTDEAWGQDTIASLNAILDRVESGEKIRLINISGPPPEGYEKEYHEVVAKLAKKHCYMIDSAVFGEVFTCGNFTGNLNDTDNINLSDWQTGKYERNFTSKIIVPVGGRLLPLWYTDDEYMYKSQSSYSWAIPILSGIFALALQVNAELSLKEFIEVAKVTAIENKDGLKVINPKGIVQAAQGLLQN